MKAFDAADFIEDYENGLVDEDGNTLEANDQVNSKRHEKNKPTGSMAAQAKRMAVNQFYAGTKERKNGKGV